MARESILMPQSYQPGHRRKDLKKPASAGSEQYSDTRYAWARTHVGQFVILVGDESNETGPDVILYIPRPGKMPDVTIALSSLTEQELDALETLVTEAFKWARPVVQKRDQEAQRAWNEGDDSFTRNYRPVPQLVFRKRPGEEHGQELQQRPESIPDSSRRDSDSDGGVRGTSDELVEPHERSSNAQDDGKTAD